MLIYKRPPSLFEISEKAKLERHTDEEKRTKVKLALSLLGPKLEIEKTITDTNIQDAWKKFWEKIKNITGSV